MKKVSVIGGGGNVGASCGLYLAERGICDVLLVDIAEGVPIGKALDLAQAGPVRGYDSQVSGTNDIKDIAGSAVVVVTAGLARKPGMSREDLLAANAAIVGGIGENIKKYAPDAFVVVVSNPLDIMTYLMKQTTGFPANRVMGMAGILDCARFCAFLGMELNMAPTDIRAMVLGGHGDSMVPLPRYSSVNGVGITDLLPADVIEKIVTRTRKGGGEIVGYLKTGSAFYAPGAGAAQMAEAILLDNKRFVAAAAYCTGQFGITDTYVGVPVILGAGGVEKIVELPLTDDEKAALQKSANGVKSGIAELAALK